MAYDGWIEFNGTELANMSRVTQLAEVLGISSVWTSPESVEWIESTLQGPSVGLGLGGGGFGLGVFGDGGQASGGAGGYADIETAPWYDPGSPASAEFAGLLPLSVRGLGDSTLESSVVEHTTDGGHSGRARASTLSLVFSAALVASTERGAEFGKRWLSRVLGARDPRALCRGSDLFYFRHKGEGAPKAHRRDVRCTRGVSVVSEREDDCSVTWMVTFTLTANDPFEYGEEVPRITQIGDASGTASGPGVLSSGSLVLTETSCPVYDYTPLYDPAYPAMVASPTVPDFLPTWWGIKPGDTFRRFWARIAPVEPSVLLTVPVIHLIAEEEARMVRVSVWSSDSPPDDQCDPLFSAVVSYLPPDRDFYIDGEQSTAYVWDGGEAVRRADSLVYAPDANPLQWAAFNDHENLLVTLDTFAVPGGGYQGGGSVRAALALVPKSD